MSASVPAFAAQSPRPFAPSDVSWRLDPARVPIPGVVPASQLTVLPAPAVVSTGIAPVDALTGGLPRGALTEVVGPASSGRTSLLVSVLAAMTARGEVCALVDAGDSFAPASAQAAGVELTRLLWVRCGEAVASRQLPVASKNPATGNRKLETGNFGRIEQALQATDLLLQSGGFGLVAVDLGDIPPQAAQRVPLTSWFRFRRAVENTPTVLLLLGRESCAKTCASLVLGLRTTGAGLRQERQLESKRIAGSDGLRQELKHKSEPRGISRSPAPGARRLPSHAELLTGISVQAELVRSRLERRPVRAATAAFATRAQWAG